MPAGPAGRPARERKVAAFAVFSCINKLYTANAPRYYSQGRARMAHTCTHLHHDAQPL